MDIEKIEDFKHEIVKFSATIYHEIFANIIQEKELADEYLRLLNSGIKRRDISPNIKFYTYIRDVRSKPSILHFSTVTAAMHGRLATDFTAHAAASVMVNIVWLPYSSMWMSFVLDVGVDVAHTAMELLYRDPVFLACADSVFNDAKTLIAFVLK